MAEQAYRARYIEVTFVEDVGAGGAIPGGVATGAMVHYRTADGRDLWLETSKFEDLFVPIVSTFMIMDAGVA